MAASPSKLLRTDDLEPLFFQPGKNGFYSPRPGLGSKERLSCFRNVGRLIGLCLLQNEICPLSLTRNVLKYILGRSISWHDLAFFDPVLYESLRQLVLESRTVEDGEQLFDLVFTVQLSQEEGGVKHDLIRNGSSVPVTKLNALDYIQRYSELRMVSVIKHELQTIKAGVFDVIPRESLNGLSPEDLRLLINGVVEINVQQLQGYTQFSDETGGENEKKIGKFKRWFWSVVDGFSFKQKQDLMYFWTSSAALPSSKEGYQPLPTVTLRPPSDTQLPTANTCVSRLYLPMYSSKALLKSKLLLAIKTKTFGFV